MLASFSRTVLSLIRNTPGPLIVGIVGTVVGLVGRQELRIAAMGGLATAGVSALVAREQQQRCNAVSELNATTEELKFQLEDLKFKKNSFSNEVNSLSNEVRSLTEQRQTLQAQLQEIETRLNKGRGAFQELQGRWQQLQQQVEQLTQEEMTLRQRLAALEEANPDWRTRDQLLAQIEQQRQQSSCLEGQIQGQQAELERLETQRQQLIGVEAELRNREVTLADLNSQVNQAREQLAELEAQLVKLEFSRQIYDRLLAEQGILQAEIERLRSEKIPLEEELQRIQKEIDNKATTYDEVARIRQELVSLERRQRELRGEIRVLESKETGLQADCESWDRTRSELERKCRQLEQDLKELEQRSKAQQEDVEAALAALKEPLWTPEQLPPSPRPVPDEIRFVEGFLRYVQAQGFQFSPRVIKAFHTALKVQGISALVVLAGISGTGKSELPRLYAEYLGAQFLLLSVQPRWDSPQDLLGFYNYIEHKFRPTTLMRGLFQYAHLLNPNPLESQDRIVLVLLDEMNLARVEYYFSEFLSKLETRRNSPENAYLDIDLGSLNTSEEVRRFYIPKQFLFVGTMNEDETTQTLSDKVLDRANVLTFGRPQQLKIGKGGQREKQTSYVTYSAFQSWYRPPTERDTIVQSLQAFLDEANSIMEGLGHPFAHRVYQAIVTYVINYPGVGQDLDAEPCRHALADQFAQKLLPKLRGVMVEEVDTKEGLKALGNFIDRYIQDSALREAFDKACIGKYGQFHWKGLVYPEEES